jgi:ankyrin repeat protein
VTLSDRIHVAAQRGDCGRVQALSKRHPDLAFSKGIRGDTPLHEAAYWGHRDVAEFLLPSHDEIDATDNRGATPSRGSATIVASVAEKFGGIAL